METKSDKLLDIFNVVGWKGEKKRKLYRWFEIDEHIYNGVHTKNDELIFFFCGMKTKK